MTDVFLSYSREDEEVARELARLLTAEHVSVFHDETSLVAGERWVDQVTNALTQAKVVIVLLSQNSKRSSWVENELVHALQHGKKVIPVLMEPGAKDNWIWPLVADRQPVNVQAKSDMARVVQAVIKQSDLSTQLAVPARVTVGQTLMGVRVSQVVVMIGALALVIGGVSIVSYRLGTIASSGVTIPGTATSTANSHQSATVVLPHDPGNGRPSLLGAFLRGRTQDFAGEGTIQPPNCHFRNGALEIEIFAGYHGYAGCYVDLPQPLDLTQFLNGVVRVDLRFTARQLEIKLERGGPGDNRQEAWIFRGQADAGAHEYVVSDLPKTIIENATRFTIALANEGDKANIITVHR